MISIWVPMISHVWWLNHHDFPVTSNIHSFPMIIPAFQTPNDSAPPETACDSWPWRRGSSLQPRQIMGALWSQNWAKHGTVAPCNQVKVSFMHSFIYICIIFMYILWQLYRGNGDDPLGFHGISFWNHDKMPWNSQLLPWGWPLEESMMFLVKTKETTRVIPGNYMSTL